MALGILELGACRLGRLRLIGLGTGGPRNLAALEGGRRVWLAHASLMDFKLDPGLNPLLARTSRNENPNPKALTAPGLYIGDHRSLSL